MSNLIPGLISSVSGEQYTYSDTSAPAGTPVCYTLEDIDSTGTRTSHGPACVYWPAPQAAAQEYSRVTTSVTQVEGETGIDRTHARAQAPEVDHYGTQHSCRYRSEEGAAQARLVRLP